MVRAMAAPAERGAGVAAEDAFLTFYTEVAARRGAGKAAGPGRALGAALSELRAFPCCSGPGPGLLRACRGLGSAGLAGPCCNPRS